METEFIHDSMTFQALVSIIIPVHNSEEYLSYCVNSVLNQTYNRIEILLIENGSTDQSYKKCMQMKAQDDRIRVYHLEDAGVSKARNYGVQQANGKYILFVDSDDYCESVYCEQMIDAAITAGDFSMPICGVQIVKGYHYDEKRCVCYGESAHQILETEHVLKIFKKGLLNSLWNKLYVRDIIVSNSIRMREDLTLGEDLLFNLEYFRAAHIKNFHMLNIPLYNYVRSGKESLDNKYYPDLWKLTNLFLDSIYEYCQWAGVEDSELYRNITYYYYIDLFDNTMSKDNGKSFRCKMAENSMIMQDEHFKQAVSGNINEIRQFELRMARLGKYFPYYIMKCIKKTAGKMMRRG